MTFSIVQETFFTRKLTVLVLALFLCAMFLPWLAEDYRVARFSGYKRGSNLYWSFMATLNNDEFLFQNFWFVNIAGVRRFFGLYVGWLLLFVCQVLIIFLWLSQKFKKTELFRGYEGSTIIVLVLITITLGVYQRFIQQEIYYESISKHFVRFHFGFWMAIVSFGLLTISYKASPEFNQIRGLMTLLKRSWKKQV